MPIPKNFWIPPALGYSPSTQGLTESQLAAIESRNGFPFPASYRSLMQQQNGETPRYNTLQDLLIEDFSCLSDTSQEFITFEDYVRLSYTPEQVAEEVSAIAQRFKYCDPKRLILFADNGHSIGCFDYGWRSGTVADEPKILFFNDDGDDFLHFQITQEIVNFDAFISQLTLPEETSEKTYIGIESSLEFEALCSFLEQAWQTQFEPKKDDFCGWFNFEKWFYGSVPLYLDDQTLEAYAAKNNTTIAEVLDWAATEDRTRLISATLSPNQHRSGTYLYPDNPELTLVLEIDKPWFPIERSIERLCNELLALNAITAVKKLP
jgi:hypothetical protein